MTQAEFDAYTAFIAAGGTAATGATNLSVLPELTITGATQIAVAVAALWGLAFIFRALSHYLKTSGDSQND